MISHSIILAKCTNCLCQNVEVTSSLWMWIIFTFIGVVLFLFALSCGWFRKILENLTRSKSFLGATFLVWFVGVVLYTAGFNHEGSLGNYWATVPRAVLSALQMFLSQSDLNDITPVLKSDVSYMICFSLTHFAAMLITALFIFKLVGFRLSNWLRIFKYTYFIKKNYECYIFWGISSQSYVLARDIYRTKKSDSGKKPIIVFVKTHGETDDGENQSVGVERLLNIIALRGREINYIEQIEALYVSSKVDLGEVDLPEKCRVFKMLQLSNLGRLIRRCSASHLFFISENENNNIRSALNLLKDDEYIAAIKQQDPKLKIYCHARNAARNEIFSNYHYYNINDKGKVSLNLIDSSYLSIMMLKSQLSYQPVSYLEIDSETATVKNTQENVFNSLIIGFGETGQEALKFYWEFGALPMYKGKNIVKSQFKCNVIDSQMDNLKSQFVTLVPALENDKTVEFVSASINSEEYWNLIKQNAPLVNAVVVSLGDDDLTMDTAVNVFKYLLKSRSNGYRRFTVFVRNYKLENLDKMRRIAETYNEACYVKCKPQMVVFGGITDIYTYDQIVSERLLKDAKRFNAVYNHCIEDSSDDYDFIWEKDFGVTKLLALEQKLIPKYLAVREITGKIQQNISNAMHVETKLYLLGYYKWEYLVKYYYGSIKRADGKIAYAIDGKSVTADQTRLENLAIAEHLRWIASYEMLGYVYGLQKDYSQKTHPCMTDYMLLDDITKSYDCNVVDTSLQLMMPSKSFDKEKSQSYSDAPLEHSFKARFRNLKEKITTVLISTIEDKDDINE